MKRKCLDIQEGGRRFVCIFQYGDGGQNNFYRLYEITMVRREYGTRESRKMLAKYKTFAEVIAHLHAMTAAGEIPIWIQQG